MVDPGLRAGGGSTLATQIEKFRHSPHGRTTGDVEKLRQMLTASARAYLDGPDTLAARRRIMTAYLNSSRSARCPGYGEIIGVPEALWIWFGTELRRGHLGVERRRQRPRRSWRAKARFTARC